MLFGLRAEAQLVDVIDDFAQVVAAVNLVFDLAKYLADLVFNRVRPAGFLFEAVQIRKQRAIHKIAQVVASARLVVIELAARILRRSPSFPAVRQVKDVGVFFAFELRFGRFVFFQPVKKFEEQQP